LPRVRGTCTLVASNFPSGRKGIQWQSNLRKTRRTTRKLRRKGGQATRERHGAQFYETIGQKGGRVVKDKYGSDFYEEIGHKGGQKVKQLIAEAKKSLAENAVNAKSVKGDPKT
jgi:general stress protein YciG